ncbi:hypothetical protein BJ741DRAFT_603829 [Chytriomyces cf. hyalinus JEL632]|nr:hypothetical protein BJ741DRAFT_603829 [Chytriomyces cf. hyalinus JEL632]
MVDNGSTLGETLDKVDTYLRLQSEIAQELRKGFMHLAEAKYVLGPDTLSQFSYDRRMQASAFCSSKSEDLDLDAAVREMHLDPIHAEPSFIAGLRSRKPVRKEDSEGEGGQSGEHDTKDIDSNKMSDVAATSPTLTFKKKDPIFMFSGFPPKSLRDAQSSFKRVLDIVQSVDLPSSSNDRM